MFEIHQGNKRVINLSFVNAEGNPGVIEGIPNWELQPPELGLLNVADDGMSAELAWSGVGSVVLTVIADGDLGDGVFPIIASETFEMVAPLGAVSGGISVSDEVPE